MTGYYRRLENKRQGRAKLIINIYIDYVNNFLTVQGFADYYNINLKTAKKILYAGKKHSESFNK